MRSSSGWAPGGVLVVPDAGALPGTPPDGLLAVVREPAGLHESSGGTWVATGAAVDKATFAASLDLEGRPWKTLTLDNSAGTSPAVAGLALSGDDAANFDLADDNAPANSGIEGFAVPAGGTAVLRVSRSALGVGAGACALTITHADGSTGTCALSADAQNTLLQNAAQIGGAATHAWSFPTANPQNDQVGSAHFGTFSGRAGASPYGGCDGYVDLASGDCHLTQTADMGRQADRTMELVISFDAAPTISTSIFVWGEYYYTATMFAQLVWFDGVGTPDDGDTGNSAALRLQGPGNNLAGTWNDTPGVAFDTIARNNQSANIGTVQNLAIYIAITYDSSTKKFTAKYKKSGDKLRSHTSAAFAGAGGDPVGDYASLGGNFGGNIGKCTQCHIHHLAFYKQVLTDSEVKEQLEVLGIGE